MQGEGDNLIKPSEYLKSLSKPLTTRLPVDREDRDKTR
jgi:hypothetical protein